MTENNDLFRIKPFIVGEYTQVIQLLKNTNLFFESTDTQYAIISKALGDPESIAVAVIGERVVGCVFVVTDNIWFNAIYHLAVDSDFHDKGIGSALLQYAEQLIKSRGGQYAAVYVMSENTKVLERIAQKGYVAIPNVTFAFKEL